jgi:hypothetical protein
MAAMASMTTVSAFPALAALPLFAFAVFVEDSDLGHVDNARLPCKIGQVIGWHVDAQPICTGP